MVANLPHYYNKDPQASPAFKVKCIVGATFVVNDGRLRATPVSGGALDLTLDRKLDALSTAMNAVSNYTGEVVPGVMGLGAVSATTLLDGTYDGASGDYVTIPYFTSTNWRMLAPIAGTFARIDSDWIEAFSQSDLRRSDGAWLDRIGRLYGILRSTNEPDSSYARRITESVIAPKCNGFAIRSILEKALSVSAVVTDTGPARFAVALILTDTSGNPYDTTAINTFIATYKAFGTFGTLNLTQSSVENDTAASDLLSSISPAEPGQWAMVEFAQSMFAGAQVETDPPGSDSLSGKYEFGRPPFGHGGFGGRS